MGYGVHPPGDCNYGRNPHNANCLECGELNGPLLSYIGRVAKFEKRTGLSFEEAERLMALRAAAVELVGGKLGARLSWAGITEADL
jgi:hypothetical protein